MPPFFVLLLDPANTGGLARRCCTSILSLHLLDFPVLNSCGDIPVSLRKNQHKYDGSRPSAESSTIAQARLRCDAFSLIQDSLFRSEKGK